MMQAKLLIFVYVGCMSVLTIPVAIPAEFPPRCPSEGLLQQNKQQRAAPKKRSFMWDTLYSSLTNDLGWQMCNTLHYIGMMIPVIWGDKSNGNNKSTKCCNGYKTGQSPDRPDLTSIECHGCKADTAVVKQTNASPWAWFS